MCLSLRAEHTTPYNNKKFRWKYAECYERTGRLSAPYAGRKYAPTGEWMTATKSRQYVTYSRNDIGFHVFITKTDAERERNNRGLFHCRVIKVEVEDFIASGYFSHRKTETWKKMRVVKVLPRINLTT